MLDCIKRLIKRGKRNSRRKNKGKNTPWKYNPLALGKSDVVNAYIQETISGRTNTYEKNKLRSKFPK